jgi:hypothetical protein
MTVQELILLVENRIRYLETMRKSAADGGDIYGVVEADKQLSETQLTLNQLKTLE